MKHDFKGVLGYTKSVIRCIYTKSYIEWFLCFKDAYFSLFPPKLVDFTDIYSGIFSYRGIPNSSSQWITRDLFRISLEHPWKVDGAVGMYLE